MFACSCRSVLDYVPDHLRLHKACYRCCIIWARSGSASSHEKLGGVTGRLLLTVQHNIPWVCPAQLALMAQPAVPHDHVHVPTIADAHVTLQCRLRACWARQLVCLLQPRQLELHHRMWQLDLSLSPWACQHSHAVSVLQIDCCSHCFVRSSHCSSGVGLAARLP